MTGHGRSPLLLLLTALFLALSSATALAASYPSGPTEILSAGFETGVSPFRVGPYMPFPTPATWGRETYRKHSGAYGLWCAGGGSNLPGDYPAGSHSMATATVAPTADLYESRLSFYYTMPSYGMEDDIGFAAGWYAAPAEDPKEVHTGLPKTAAGKWRWVDWDMSVGHDVSLSRNAGVVYFKWRDDTENVSQPVKVGEGPSVDDVRVVGYKYGPVRSLQATLVCGGVRLAWLAPYAKPGVTDLEARPIRYRVWRFEPGGSATDWTEVLSGASITSTTCTDTSAVAEKGYRYVVQAWDQPTGSGHGRGVKVDIGSTRVYGTDQFAASVRYSRLAFPSVLEGERAVVIVNGYAWPDALGGSALAGAVRGPMLMVADNPQPALLPSAVKTEIKRLGARKAYIIGGTAVVSTDIEAALKKTVSGIVIERLAGRDRYATSQKVAEKLVELRGKGGDVFIATGLKYPDALAASSIAAAERAPIVLTKRGGLPAASQTALRAVAPRRVTVCGGDAVVSANVLTQVKSITGVTAVRKGGGDRYKTAKLLIDYGITTLVGRQPGALYVARGTAFTDALLGGVVAGLDDGWQPLMLTKPTSLVPEAQAIVTQRPSIRRVTVLGTTASVSAWVMTTLLDLLSPV